MANGFYKISTFVDTDNGRSEMGLFSNNGFGAFTDDRNEAYKIFEKELAYINNGTKLNATALGINDVIKKYTKAITINIVIVNLDTQKTHWLEQSLNYYEEI